MGDLLGSPRVAPLIFSIRGICARRYFFFGVGVGVFVFVFGRGHVVF